MKTVLFIGLYDRPFAINNFQKKILGINMLERLEKKVTGTASRATYLYRFRR
ncbi:NrtR DNA-binding winged helix domain-containing protein [Haliscomenobacter sp.]|uniref:NrtR DNA-binding winged helix domain-containing protein n=1 Tax=Haliscomenobacter sp. TaxID=2717303 RepID=UPI003BAC8B42